MARTEDQVVGWKGEGVRYNIRHRKRGRWLAEFTYLEGVWYWKATRKPTATVRILEFPTGKRLERMLRENEEYEAVPVKKVGTRNRRAHVQGA